MVLEKLLLVMSLKFQRGHAKEIILFHFVHKMTQVPEHGAQLFPNQDYAKLQQVVHFASNLMKGYSHLVQPKIKEFKKIQQSIQKDKTYDDYRKGGLIPALDAFALAKC